MHRFGRLHSALIAGWTCLALVTSSGASAEGAPDDPSQLLKHADTIKTANHDEFTATLKQLDTESARLTPAQALYLRYLKGWQGVYAGDYATALPELDAVASDSTDVTLRFRAGMTAVNLLAIAARYEEAYARLNEMLDLLPKVSDPMARRQGLLVTAELYDEAGQYNLGLLYVDQLFAENPSATTVICKGMQLRLNALYKSGKLQTVGKEFQNGIDACVDAGEPLYANLIRFDAAKLYIASGHPDTAIKLLKNNYGEAESTHYPEVIADIDSALARAYWKVGDNQQAQLYAQRAVDGGIKDEYTEALVGAYEVLYQIAQKQGDYPSALAWHEKFAAADKGYLNLSSVRMLAYQMVKQEVQAKRMQVDALNKKNQVLQLQQTVSAKDAVTGRLWIALLLVVLGSIGMYAYRTKRSQLKFQKLAQRDGLTGIYNRQHFIEASEQALDYGAKSVRDASVIVIDLDHFKQINDEHGHAAGDMVLKRVVAACQMHLRSVDVFGRLGGEEFGILMPDCVPERAADQAEQMRLAIAEMAGFEDGPDFPVCASFGISAARWSGYDLRQLLAHADSALYQAKREGRNRVCVYAEPSADIQRDRRQH